jgi:tRNA A-37 threonylcarbamoyl transferase component Bud32
MPDVTSEGLAVERVAEAPLEAVLAAIAAPGETLAASDRGRTRRVPWDARSDAVVKETTRGFLDRLRASRARRAFRASQVLAAAGVPVPAPLACVEGRGRAYLLSRHVAGERGDRVERTRELAVSACELAARIHAAGVAHGDFKPANLLVSPGGLFVLDLDAARTGAGPPRRALRARDLGALDAYGQRSEPRLSRRIRRQAFQAYLALAPFETEPDELLRAVVLRSRLKLRRWAT